MEDKNFVELKNRIDISKNILILPSDPDGDSIGSSIAIYNCLKLYGKSCEVISSFSIPEYLQFLPETQNIKIEDVGSINFNNYDLIITLDSTDSYRVVDTQLYTNEWDFPPESFIVSFDHHHSHNFDYANINIFDQNATSTCQIIYEFINYLNIKLDKLTATALYLGMHTDSLGFSIKTADHKAFYVASKLLEAGANKEEIIINLNRPYKYSSVKLYTEVIQTLEITEASAIKYVIAVINENQTKLNTPNVVDEVKNLLLGSSGFIRNIEATDFGLLLIEREGNIQVSFREKIPIYDLTKICSKYGGGGHPAACGFVYKGSIEQLKQDLFQDIKELSHSV